MGTSQTDMELVRRVQAGEKNAFDVLVLKYQQRVVNLVMRYVRDQHIAMDISQEAFIKAYKGLQNFRGDSAFYTWLYRIAVNTAKNYLVSRGRRPPLSDVDIEDAMYFEGNDRLKDFDNPQNKLSSDELMEKVNHSIKALPEDLRVALTLREYDGMSYEEIADVMDCPVGTVRSRIFRAREAVEQAIQPLLEHTEVA